MSSVAYTKSGCTRMPPQIRVPLRKMHRSAWLCTYVVELGAAYARGADSHEEGSLMLDDVASVVADQSATSMASGPGT